jgi:hypothetical protein
MIRDGRCPVSTAQQGDARYKAYRDAIQKRVCAVCLDGADDGSCGLEGEGLCAIDQHLPRVVEVVTDVAERREGGYAGAVETRICTNCPHRDALGRCHLRRDGQCALLLYLPLVVEAIQEVETRHRGEA